MKRLLLILILTLSLQSWTKADDISDFQIEGMSIGDSLLDYFSEEEIKINIQKNLYKNKKDKTFITGAFSKKKGHNFITYDVLQINLKRNDKDYIIYGLTGKTFSNYHEDIEACFIDMDKVFAELEELFKNQEKKSPRIVKLRADKSGKSKVRQAAYIFKNQRDLVVVSCYDWDKNMRYRSNFKISLSTKELNDWLVSDN